MDIDIDLRTTFDPLAVFPTAIRASMVKDGELIKHPCGVYFQNIPRDSITGFAAIPYKQAEDMGYTKIDFLHLSVLDNFNSKEEIKELLKLEPNWKLLRYPEVVEKLFHLSKWYDLLQIVAPKSVIELADCLALIRPGKQHLANDYIKDPTATRAKLYKLQPGEKYNFKKSHAVAYAMVIVLQLHLIEGEII